MKASLINMKASATKLWPQAWWMALALCTFATACKESKQTPPPAPPPVTVATPIRKEIVEWDEYTGRTAAVERVEIRPRVSGYIDRISFEEGQLVKPGDVLFVIDPRPYQDVLDQASANLQAADAQQQLQVANLARAEKLFQTNVTAKEQYDQRCGKEQGRGPICSGPGHGKLGPAQHGFHPGQIPDPGPHFAPTRHPGQPRPG